MKFRSRRGLLSLIAGLTLVVAVTVTLTVVRHGHAPSKPSAARPVPGGGCASVTVSELPPNLAPACGVLWGFYSPHNSVAATQSVEASVGRQFNIVKHYHDFSNTANGIFPTGAEIAQANGGRILHESWDAAVYQRPGPAMPAPDATTSKGRQIYSWGTIASGELDNYIDAAARRVAAFGRPLFMDFGHESDIADPVYGTPADFVAAYRHVVDRFRAEGATNVVWAWVVSGTKTGPDSDALYRSLYPGNDVVDWIGWDPYNHIASRWLSPLELFQRFYHRIDSGMLGPGAAAKPRLLGEYGCAPDPRRAAWFAQVPAALQQLPKLKAVEYFNSGSWAELDQAATPAFAQAGRQTYVSTVRS